MNFQRQSLAEDNKIPTPILSIKLPKGNENHLFTCQDPAAKKELQKRPHQVVGKVERIGDITSNNENNNWRSKTHA